MHNFSSTFETRYLGDLKKRAPVIDEQSKDQFMATSITGISFASPVPAIPAVQAPPRRRQISPQAGHALEILGHAIEYLADEFVRDAGTFSARDPRVEAIQILMALNRQVYFACPEAPTLAQRIQGWLHRHHPRHEHVSS